MSGYIFPFHGTQYTPDGAVSVPNADDHNREVERLELDAWAAGPDRAIGYVTHDEHFDSALRSNLRWLGTSTWTRVTVTTWLGTPIAYGSVTNVHRNNFGARIVMIRVRGTNGRTYIGRYGYDSGSLIRLRAAKKVR